MKKISKLLMFSVISMVLCATIAGAESVPIRIIDDDGIERIISTEKPAAKETEKATPKTVVSDTKKSKEKETEKATSKASEKASEKETEKATSKASEKASEKETEKATSKASEKASEKATEKPKSSSKPSSSPKATATIKPTVKPTAKNSTDDEDSDDKKIVLDSEEDALVLETTPEPSLNIQNGSELLENKKYLTKGGAFLWFLFTVLVSAIISFAISYRFYMMGRRDNHVLAEIRALKRDIDTKMVGTISGFAESDISVTNSNKNFSKENSPIRSGVEPVNEEANNEIYKKWESQINRVQKQAEEREFNDVRTVNTRTPRPNIERRRPISRKNVGFTGKIKNVLNDIFPFDKK